LGIFHSHPSIFPSRHFFSPWLLPHAQQAKRREQGQPWRGTLPASPGERLGQGAFFPNATPAPSRRDISSGPSSSSELAGIHGVAPLQLHLQQPWRSSLFSSALPPSLFLSMASRSFSLPWRAAFLPMARRRCSLFFSISPCSLGRQQPWRGLLFFSWRSSKLPHGRRPGKLPQWRQQQGSLPPPHGAQKIAARLLCSSSPWSRFCAELRAGACHGRICPLHGCPLLFPAPSSLYPAPPFFFHGKPTASPLPRCSSWCPPAVRQNAQQPARCRLAVS
jgi:hypothetical protein